MYPLETLVLSGPAAPLSVPRLPMKYFPNEPINGMWSCLILTERICLILTLSWTNSLARPCPRNGLTLSGSYLGANEPGENGKLGDAGIVRRLNK
jgi:hypothetical protein